MTLRVLAWPYEQGRFDSPYPYLLGSALRRLGADVQEFSLRRLATERIDIVHVHWPDSLLYRPSARHAATRAAAFVTLLRVARARGARLVWTVHNLGSHERHHPRIGDAMMRSFVRQVDGWISLSESGVADIVTAFPRLGKRPHAVVPSGHYADEYPDTVGRAEARGRLDVSPAARVVAFVGQIRPYKDVPALIRAFRDVSDPEAVLIVAGRPLTPGLAAQIEAEARGDDRIRLRLQFVDAADMQYLLHAADLVALPYREIFNSGSAVLALTFGCPVLVPALGGLAELGTLAGDGWVRTYTGTLDAGALDAALRAPRPTTGPDLSAFDWDRVAAATAALYRRLAAPRTGTS